MSCRPVNLLLMNLSIKISRSQFIESSFGDRDKKQNANIIRREGNKWDPRKEENAWKSKFGGETGARLTWSRRRSRGIVCRALIFTDFSTYSERAGLKSSLAASERHRCDQLRDKRTPSLKTHADHSTFKKNTTFPSYRSAEVGLGNSLGIIPVRPARRRIKSSQTPQLTRVNRNNPLV